MGGLGLGGLRGEKLQMAGLGSCRLFLMGDISMEYGCFSYGVCW
jgi:hypothetical protein